MVKVINKSAHVKCLVLSFVKLSAGHFGSPVCLHFIVIYKDINILHSSLLTVSWTMPACAAYGCNHRPERDRNKTFHKFPWKNEKLFKIWLENINREFMPSKSTVICSDHFEESKFDRTGQTTRLRENAAPTIFATLTSILPKVCKPCMARRKKLCLHKFPTNMSSPQAELSLLCGEHCKALKNGISAHKLPASSTITQSEHTLPSAKSCMVRKKKITPEMLTESTSTSEPEPSTKRCNVPRKRPSPHMLPANMKSPLPDEPVLISTKRYKCHKKGPSPRTLPESTTTPQAEPSIPCTKWCKVPKKGLSPQILPASMTVPKTEPSLPCPTQYASSVASMTAPQAEPSLPCPTQYTSSVASMTAPKTEPSLPCPIQYTSSVASTTAQQAEPLLPCPTPFTSIVASTTASQAEPSLPCTTPCTSSEETTPSTLMGSHSYDTVDHFVEPELEDTGPNTRFRANAVPNIYPASPSHSVKTIRWCKKHYKAPKVRSADDLPESTTPQEETSVSSAKPSSTESSISTIMGTHSYAIMDSPRKLKQKLDATLDELQKVKKKLKSSEQSKRRLSMRVNSLKEVIASLRTKKSTSKKGSCKLRDSIILHFPPLGLEPKPHNNNNNYNYYNNNIKKVNGAPLDVLPESSVILIQC